MYRLIIITGASSGIGAEFARALAVRNVDEVWLVARRADRLERLAAELTAAEAARAPSACAAGYADLAADKSPKGGPVFRALAADTAGRSGGALIAALLAETAAAHRDLVIDTLVNNAGFGTYGPFADVALDRQLDEIDVNVTGVTAICGAALPYLAAGSRLINTASLAAYAPMGAFAVYAATKAYVLYFSLGLAAELAGRGVKVLALCPGPVDTEFSNVASGGVRRSVLHGKNPAKVVAHCLRCLDSGKHIAIMAALWKIKAVFGRLLPLPFLARLTMKTEKRPTGPI
jgi:short-subunit dehydrogenase